MFGGLPKYKVLEKLGSGGMGEVYKAEDLDLLREVAIKVVTKSQQATEAEKRFLREARAASSINHPNIVTIYEIGETDRHAYIVMEYVEGRSLRSLIAGSPLEVEAIISIALQIADAMSAAHARGIIHRDIKPENIIVNERGRVKLLDFGLAKNIEPAQREPGARTAMESLTAAGAVMGTLSYMSPEQLRGELLDERTDIFSFGIVLHEMITGTLPFTGANSFDVAAAILKDEARRIARLPEGMSAKVINIVERLLDKDKRNRHSTFAEVRRELESLKREQSQSTGEIEQPQNSGSLYRTKQLVVRSGASSQVSLKLSAPPTVLVLPLDMVGTTEDSFIGVGLAQAITTDLARITGISVLSKTVRSARHDKSEVGARELAREFGATILLEGEVVRAGETLGVMARLTDVETGRVIWGAQYRGDAADLFSIQDAVCESVAAALKVTVSNEVRTQMARPATTNLDAFEFYSKGQAFIERRDVKENIDYAVQMFAAALELDNDFALAYAGLGEAYWLKYRATRESLWVERAIAASDHALALDPYQAQIRISLGIVYYETGKIDLAAKEFEQAIATQPMNDNAHRWLALCYMRKGDVNRAVEYFSRAIELRPGYWENYSRLGICYYTFGRYQDAAEQFRRVIMIQPDNYVGYSTLGGIYTLLGSYEDAIVMLKRAIGIYPNASSYGNLGTCYFFLGRCDDAITSYLAAIELDARNDILHRNLGDAYLCLGKSQEAEAQFKRASQLLNERLVVSPKNPELLGRLAICQAKLKSKDEALASIKQATSVEPRNTTLMYQKAVVYALIGLADEAIKQLGDALASGYSRSEAERDPDLQSLRTSAEYQSLFADKPDAGSV